MTIYASGTELIRNDGVKFTADGRTDYGSSYSVTGSEFPQAYGTNATTQSGEPNTSLYGYDQRNSDWEGPALTTVRGTSSAAGTSGLVDPNFLETIMSDSSILGFYVNALAYGGYTVGDILNDMKRREMISSGNQDVVAQAEGLKLIDPEMTKSAYQATAEGQKAYRESASIIPTFNLQGLINPEILKYGANMPENLFKTLVPILDNTSQEFKDAVANVKSAFYDLANQQLQATTEQEKAVADYNYEQFKKQIEENYGLALSDDASKAWTQINELENTFSTRGISRSGLETEAIDDVLQSARKQDQRFRQEKLTKEESQLAATYTASATPAQIKALIEEDKAKGLPKDQWRATKWGLVPSDDLLAKYDMASLKQRFPNQSEEELKAYRDSVLDENGNYRSTLYGKYYGDVAKNLQSKKSTAETQVLQDTLNKETAAYRNYDQSQPFSVATKADDAMVASQTTPNPANQGVPLEGIPQKTTEPTSDELKSIQDQIDKIRQGITAYTQKKTPSYTSPKTPVVTPPKITTSTTSTTAPTTSTTPNWTPIPQSMIPSPTTTIPKTTTPYRLKSSPTPYKFKSINLF